MFKRPLGLASLVGVAAVLFVSAEPRDVEAARLAADDILREIKSEGPGPVLWRLWNNPTRFDEVCGKIASGTCLGWELLGVSGLVPTRVPRSHCTTRPREPYRWFLNGYSG